MSTMAGSSSAPAPDSPLGGCPDWAAMSLEELRSRHADLLAQLRRAEHWRRLVAARLDLAIAAVADIDDLPEHWSEPAPVAEPECPGHHHPDHLRDLLGIPRQEGRLGESAMVLLLRDVLCDLATYAADVRRDADGACRELVHRLGTVPSLGAEMATVVQLPRPRPGD